MAATPGAILLSPQGPSAPAQLLALVSAVALAVAFCAAAWIVSSPGGRPVFRLLLHASLAALSGWIAWQCVHWCLALTPTEPLLAVGELPGRFRHLVPLLRARYGVLPAPVPTAAAWVCLTAAICAAVLVVDLATGRGAAALGGGHMVQGPRRRGAALDRPGGGRCIEVGLNASPVAEAGAYLRTDAHPHDAKLQTEMIAGGLSIVCWVVPVKPRGRDWRLFLLGVHAGAAAIAGEIFSSTLSWRPAQRPDNPLRAAWSFPRPLSGHVDWLRTPTGDLPVFRRSPQPGSPFARRASRSTGPFGC